MRAMTGERLGSKEPATSFYRWGSRENADSRSSLKTYGIRPARPGPRASSGNLWHGSPRPPSWGDTERNPSCSPGRPLTGAQACGGRSLPSTHSSGPYRGGIHSVLLFPLIPAVFNLLHHLGLGLGHQLPQSLVTGDTADEGMLRGEGTGLVTPWRGGAGGQAKAGLA